MGDTTESLRRKIASAGDLHAVVRTMKALAASSIGQYERSVHALADYYRAVELGLGACLRREAAIAARARVAPAPAAEAHVIVFGSDMGLVGQFNDVIADHADHALAAIPGKCLVWSVGERVGERLAEAGRASIAVLSVPTTIEAIAPLVGQIQLEIDAHGAGSAAVALWVFHNQPLAGSHYEPVGQRLWPPDARWQHNLAAKPWPSSRLPETLGDGMSVLRALVREYLFISLFRACAESLASENASRLAAMDRADRNIGDLVEGLHDTFHRLRQDGIDEELFDVVSGYEALGGSR